MRTSIFIVLLFIIITGTLFAQEQYPKLYQAGTKIEHMPGVNVYIISETQFNNTLRINELYKNCEKRIELLQTKIAQQDSLINLLREKEQNFQTTLDHTSEKLSQCTDESQACQKDLVKQKTHKKALLGIAGLEALVLILVLAL
jgi:uncharacterized coiled-coil protein SlyX